MLDVARDIHSLTDFKRRTPVYLDLLRGEERAFLLTVNGKAELAVMSAETFQRVLDALDELDTIRGIREGLDQMSRGEGVSLEEFDRSMRKKHGLSNRSDAERPEGDGP